MESTIQPLEYQRLPSRFIRLFGINPGQPDDDINGILIQQDLDALDHTNNPFLALSYTWGDATHKTAAITVKNITTGQTGTLTITVTLWNALRNIRNPVGAIGVWVDQICIDQSSDEEKGQQILHMRQIYERANWVVARLDDFAECDLAMDLLMGNEWSQISDTSEALNAALSRVGHEPTPDSRRGAFRAINALLNQRYWTRTWIWQEATAQPDEGIFYHGTRRFRLRNVIQYVISWKQYLTTGGTLDQDWDDSPIWRMTQFIDFWVTRRLQVERPLLALLDQVRRSEITDPRDKVFAVLPFASDAQDFRPAYHVHTHVVYTTFAIWHMVKYQSLDVITFSKGDLARLDVEGTSGRLMTKIGEHQLIDDDDAAINDYETVSLASWVPDWRVRSFARDDQWKESVTISPLRKAEHIFDPTLPRLYKASGSESAALQFSLPEEQVMISGLTVHGVKIATIEYVQRKQDVRTISLEVEEDWYRDFQAVNVSNWDYAGDHLFKRTIYTDITVRNVQNIPRYARATSPDDQLTWPHRSQDQFLHLGQLKAVTRGRAPFRTKGIPGKTTGLYGLGPLWAQPGDEVWILKGASVPFILRHRTWNRDVKTVSANLITGSPDVLAHHEGDPSLFFVGEGFVLGLMDGEVLELMQLGEHDSRRRQVPELEREFCPLTLY